MRSFLKFGGLSGLGWILDFCLLLLLVGNGLPAASANFISSATAATCVFLVSRKLVFRGSSERVAGRVLVYFLYTLAVICIASVALQWLVKLLAAAQPGFGIDWNRGTLSALAKVLITPPQLVLNFVVARFVAQRSLRSHHAY